jgi:hypothetical protein
MILKIQQGRTVDLVIAVETSEGEPYTLQTGDTIRFGVRPCFGGNKVIFKTLTSADEVDGEYPLTLAPEDTNITPQRYLYDVSLQLADGSLYDIMPTDYFVVKGSTTFKGESE